MTAQLTRPPAGVLPPPVRRPHEYVAALLVTAAAYQTVSDQLDGAVTVDKLDDGALGDVPRYRLTPRRGGNVARPPAVASSATCPLSPREWEVLRFVAVGRENREIATALSLSVETVRTHVKNLLRKLQARDRTHAVHIAHVQGWLGGSDDAS